MPDADPPNNVPPADATARLLHGLHVNILSAQASHAKRWQAETSFQLDFDALSRGSTLREFLIGLQSRGSAGSGSPASDGHLAVLLPQVTNQMVRADAACMHASLYFYPCFMLVQVLGLMSSAQLRSAAKCLGVVHAYPRAYLRCACRMR